MPDSYLGRARRFPSRGAEDNDTLDLVCRGEQRASAFRMLAYASMTRHVASRCNRRVRDMSFPTFVFSVHFVELVTIAHRKNCGHNRFMPATIARELSRPEDVQS